MSASVCGKQSEREEKSVQENYYTRKIYIRNGMNSQFISCRKGRKIKHEDNWQYSSRASTHSSLRSIVMRLRINQILFEHIFNLVYFSI